MTTWTTEHQLDNLLTNTIIEQSVDDRSGPTVAEHEQCGQVMNNVTFERAGVMIVFMLCFIKNEVDEVPRRAAGHEQTEYNE